MEIAHCLRQNLGKRAIQSNLREHLKASKHLLEEHFHSSEMNFYINQKRGYENRTIVIVKDIDAFVKHIISTRNINPHNHIVRIGLDGGGNFLKICLSIFEMDVNIEMPFKKRRRSKEIDFLNTGVKKSFIVAIVEDISETYDNIQKILLHIHNLNCIKFFMCNDLKATAIVLGIQNANAIYPCPICEVNDLGLTHDHLIKHKPRTLDSIATNAKHFKENKCKRSEARKYFSCVEQPLIPGEPDMLVGDIIVPPELHIMQGVVKHLYDNMVKEWDGATCWLKELGLEPQKYHSGTFLGNHCHKMLQHIDELRRIAPIYVLKYVTAFETFSKVVHSTFGMTLRDNYENHIHDFTVAFMDLNITVTLKVHMVLAHVSEFVNKFGALGWYSEQTTESSHSDFKKNTYEKHNFQRPIGSPKYAQNLLKAVVVHNSTRI